MSDVKADQIPAVRPWHAFAVGSALALVALCERVQGFRSGHQYVLCHASPALDRLTLTALALVAGALLAAVVGAATATLRGKPSRPAFLIICMLAALAFVITADGVDAHGERQAAALAAAPFSEISCDYAPQVYTATPGWFTW
ncbi:hypothetical protein ACGF1Z_11720 [Streptomyces sp. NPDC048018]|uniref:hypothetical protein n=1 Tax=Streptomyces sp. NPDC048018 TaxID=3365499 RepID=UPI0037234F46